MQLRFNQLIQICFSSATKFSSRIELCVPSNSSPLQAARALKNIYILAGIIVFIEAVSE